MFSEENHIKESTPNDINTAAENANVAFNEYRNISAEIKTRFLLRIAQGIDNTSNELAELASKETSLPVPRLESEIHRTVNQLKLFAAMLEEGSWVRAIIDTGDPDRKPISKPDLRQMQFPLGPVAVFGASNFPFAYSVCGGDTAAALAAGCPVIYKANPGHPQTSDAVAGIVIDAVKETGVPNGVFAIIHGGSHETGTCLIMHQHVKAVGFTGSFKGGRALFDAAAKREEPIPVYAEMGSTNPVFILPGALKQKAGEIARQLAASNTASAGQFCTNPGIMVAENAEGINHFYNEFAAAIKQTPSSRMLTEPIFQSFEKSMKEVSGKANVSVVAVAESQKKGTASAHMFRLSASDFLGDKSLWEEMFGPSSIQVEASNTDEMMKIALSLHGQLTATVWGTDEDLEENRKLIKLLELKAGRIIINGVPTGVEVANAMNHGGPYPATTDSKFTSVGPQSIYRFTRPVCYQNFPQTLLPEELKDGNPRNILRMVNGEFVKN